MCRRSVVAHKCEGSDIFCSRRGLRNSVSGTGTNLPKERIDQCKPSGLDIRHVLLHPNRTLRDIRGGCL